MAHASYDQCKGKRNIGRIMHSKPHYLKLFVADANNNCPIKAVAHIRYGFTSVINEASNRKIGRILSAILRSAKKREYHKRSILTKLQSDKVERRLKKALKYSKDRNEFICNFKC